MRRTDRKKPTCEPMSPETSSAAYTAAQREQLQQGLRILARMIVRVHLRRQASRAASGRPEQPFDDEVGG